MEFEKKVIVDVDGFIESGKQFDLDLKLPEDKRNVVYGIIRDHHGKPVTDAVVKLVEVCKDERKPVSHTFTDKEGEFVFGPLCPHKSYSIEIWVNRVKHIKICKICEKEGKCLKGVDLYCDKEYMYDDKRYDEEYEDKYDKKHDEKYEDKYDKKYDEKYEDNYDKKYDEKYEDKYDKKHEE